MLFQRDDSSPAALTPYARPPIDPPLWFRGRFAPVIGRALLAGAAGWLVAGALEHRGLPPAAPLIAALLAGGAVLAIGTARHYTARGIRVDSAGISSQPHRTWLGWDEVTMVRADVEEVRLKGGSRLVRYCSVQSADGRRIAFADLAPAGLGWVQTAGGRVIDLPSAGLLMAIVADRLDLRELFPPEWVSGTAPVDERSEPAPSPSARRDAANPWSLLKTIKISSVAIALPVMAVLLSWKAAVLLLAMIAIHELGHVQAMRSVGIRVRGVWLIPMVGGAAVSEGLARTRLANAYVQINGPVYGLGVGVGLAALYWATRNPLWAQAMAINGLINLFNLLPVMPLDGGRLLGEVANSLHRNLGRAAVGVSLVLGGVMVMVLGHPVVVVIVLVGAMEFARQLAAANRRSAVAVLPPDRPMRFETWQHFCRQVRPVWAGCESRAQTAAQRSEFEMLHVAGNLVPMRPWQTALVVGAYLGLAGVLVAMVVLGSRWGDGAQLL